MQIHGLLFNPQDTVSLEVEMIISSTGFISFTNSRLPQFSIFEATISPRVGNTSRYIDLPQGYQFETVDNDSVDKIAETFKPSRLNRLIHRLEAAKEFVAVLVVMLIGIGWLMVEYGIPKIADEVAMMLPTETSDYIGQEIVESLDEYWFKPTHLDEETQRKVRDEFKTMATNVGHPEVELLFRQSNIGANALALPDGKIILADELYVLAESSDEVNAVLLHEIGHIHHRHSLRKLIEAFSMSFLVMTVTGDVSAGSSVIASAPAFIIQASYSQHMELEADDYSLAYMQANDIDPESFAKILTKLEISHTHTYQNCLKEQQENQNRIQNCLSNITANEPKREQGFGYLSSHPATEERLKKFRAPQ